MVTMNNDRITSGSFGTPEPLKKDKAGQSPASLFFPKGKKAFELQFHWIFVLVAGALILSFFVSVAYKQRDVSQTRLQLTLVTEVENIFTGAIVGKGAQSLPVPPQGIEFECSETCYCRFSIGGEPRDFGEKAIFAPRFLEDRELFVWALPWKQPYRVTNFLLITNPNIKYYFVYDDADSFSKKTLLEPIIKRIPPAITERGVTVTEFNYDAVPVTQLAGLQEEDFEHTKFVFLNVDAILPADFRRASTSAVKIDRSGVGFYERQGSSLRLIKYLSYTGLSTLYAAIFSDNHIMYECQLKTAFRKLSQISELYAQRAAVLQEKAFSANKLQCAYGSLSPENVCQAAPDPSTAIGMLCQQHFIAKSLTAKIEQSQIAQLSPLMEQLDSTNRNFVQQSCPEIF